MKKERVFLTGVYFLALSLLLGLSNGLNAQPLPDLVVTKIECVPLQGKLGVEVMNKSDVLLPKGWKAVADVYFGKVKEGFIDLGSPTKGDITLPGGTAYYLTAFKIVSVVNVRVVADATNSIKESNETNNTLTVKIAPCLKFPKPDLVVEKIWAEYAPNIGAPPGKKYYLLYFTIRNIGILNFNGTLKVNVSVPSPPPGASIWTKYEGKVFKGNPLTIPNFKLFPNAVWKFDIVGPPIEMGWLSGITLDCTVSFSTNNPAEYSKNNEKTQKLTLPD